VELESVVRDDPVPGILWRFGCADALAPGRILASAGSEAAQCAAWRVLADAIASGRAAGAADIATNGSFADSSPRGLTPDFLYPRSGALPAGWEVRAMPTENGRVSLVAIGDISGGRAVRIEGAWDTQLYQWKSAEPGCIYVALARFRGVSGPGSDDAIYLTFLGRDGKVAGAHRMASLPKGPTGGWRTLVLADAAPAGAAWVGVGVGSARQGPGDWLEAAGLELRRVNR
jgi:hypothetical protein